jgi:hypothetical protein
VAIDRIVSIPRWSGTADSDFYPWLREQLGREIEIETVPLLPAPNAPEVAATVDAAVRILGADPEVLGRTLVIGHSVGVQVAMRALASLPEGTRVQALVGVAGWWSVDQPWASLLPWQEPFAFEGVRSRCVEARILISDDDPFTAGFETTARLFAERIGAEVGVVRGAKHFNGATAPAVLEVVRAALARASAGGVRDVG